MDDSLIFTTFLACTISAVATYVATPITIAIAKKFHLVDDPAKRYHPAHTHVGIIPRAGGLALFIGIVLTSYMFLPSQTLFLGALTSGLLLTIIGLLDDKKDVNPFIRLFTNSIAALIVIFAGASVPYVTNPLTGGVIDLTVWNITVPLFGGFTIVFWSQFIAFVWIMWTMNIVGWSSGVDGQMPGFVSISAFIIGILSLRFSMHDPTQLPTTFLSFIVAGAFAGFLPWNFYPQKIMPGYGGKTLAGFLLGLLAILSYAKLGTALLVLGIPMMDAIYTLIRRIVRKKSPMKADWGHLHHKLLELGWGKRRIALFYWTVSAILGIIALSVKSEQKVFALLLFSVIIGGFLLWVNFFSQFSKPLDQDSG